MKTFNCGKNDSGRTLVSFLQKVLVGVPFSRVQKALRQKDVKINGTRIKDPKYLIKEGDIISVYGVSIERKIIEEAVPKFETIYEDANILVLNKPEGFSVHGDKDCIDNQVLTYLNTDFDPSFLPSHVGRLDKVTSGVMIYGKTYEAVRQLNDAQKEFTKKYLMKSRYKGKEKLELKIHHLENDQKMVIDDRGDDAILELESQDNGLVEATLITGKKHQIRATMEHLKFPIKGDIKYGSKRAKRVFLHSWYLKLNGLTGNLEYLNNQVFKNNPDWK